jgi:chitinase
MQTTPVRRPKLSLILALLPMLLALIFAGTNAHALAPAWDGNFKPYAVGAIVSYNGVEYQCRQAHTSQPDWTPPATPALWLQLSGTQPTVTPTSPTGPTVTPTIPSGPTVTPTVPSGPTVTPTVPSGPTVTPVPPSTGRKIVGYFVQWGVYGRNYQVKNIKTSGSASKLTHINYAFGNVVNSRCQIGDPYADYDKFYDASQSVDGQSDTWDNGALRGNFNQLRKLKAQYPNLKVLISLGGWTWSSGFSDAALPQNRVAFVQSCVDLFIKDQRWAGVFDGIDVDWEYPGACGNSCNFRPEDTQNFTALLAEFRRQLNATRPGLLLTIAAPAGPDKIDKIEINNIHPHLDFINLMTYDFHGAWENTTNFNANLFTAAGDPAQGNARVSVDQAVATWLQRGTPANKLVVGVPFYGRGWQGVGSANNGLWQPSGGAAPGTYEQGIEDYKVLKGKGWPRFFNSDAQAAWLFGNGQFWSYDDPAVMAIKMNYVKTKGLAGVMFWELSGDTSDGELITTLYNNR